MSEWIKCSERLPERGKRVLMYSPNNEESDTGAISVQMGWVAHNKLNVHGITHWMPLPDKPEE